MQGMNLARIKDADIQQLERIEVESGPPRILMAVMDARLDKFESAEKLLEI